MKYLDDEKLTQLTHGLTDVLCGSSRVINGRIESYTMKRCSLEKKYAQNLSEKYEHQFGVTDRQCSGKSTKGRKQSRLISPLGDFRVTETRRLMTDLILTLNASFPDYDFGSIKPDHFSRIDCPRKALDITNRYLNELSQHKPNGFLQNLWYSIDQSVALNECEIYRFVQDDVILSAERERDADPFFVDVSARYNASGDYGEHSASPSCVGQFYNDSTIGNKTSSFNTMDCAMEGRSVGAPLWSFNYFFVNKQLKRILFFTCTQSCVKDNYDHGNFSYEEYEENGALGDVGVNRMVDEDDADYGSGNFDMDVEELETVGGVSVAISSH